MHVEEHTVRNGNKRAMTLIAEMVLIVIVSFTDHVAVLYDDDNNNFYL